MTPSQAPLIFGAGLGLAHSRLPLSAFFEAQRPDDYDRLPAASRDGEWESWQQTPDVRCERTGPGGALPDGALCSPPGKPLTQRHGAARLNFD